MGRRPRTGDAHRWIARRARRMAPILHRSRQREPALASYMDSPDAPRSRPASRKDSETSRNVRDCPPAFGLGNIHRPLLFQLHLVFPDHLAAVLSRATTRLLLADHVTRGRRSISRSGSFSPTLRMARGPLDHLHQESNPRAQG